MNHGPLVLVCAAIGTAAGCGSTGDDASTVSVFAASSLTDAFERIEEAYESANPDVDLVMTFAGSSTLANQIEQGAPADVFAAADEATMQRVVESGRAASPTAFATNSIAIVVERGNPLGIAGLDGLAGDDLVLVLASPEVPIGAYAADALRRAGVDAEPDSFERDARAVLAKVALGEADAGIVFATDPLGEDDVDVVAIPAELNVRAVYPLARLGGGGAEAERFIEFVASAEGRAILDDEGFGAP